MKDKPDTTPEEPKRKPGRPPVPKEKRAAYTSLHLSKESSERLREFRQIASKELGIDLSNPQFMQLMLNHWEKTHHLALKH
tara:strand:- start:5978 stop:6220 length:243 start_codon:yes stop_codon:yes gene_type:complete